ncbi:hypothetical protein ARMSODRAFT_1000127 [Armillaria solidipes]|uniref:DUF155 domain-containing protein n=1 Tax=Armillaria solidipes TaxID=1076256 RepID=A0A2H3BY80_9AGAR|nr:hypothetical protein ARMSODRAFT_1000127 [Armillaria solidipes]
MMFGCLKRSIFSQTFRPGRSVTVPLTARRFASSTPSAHSIDSDQTERAKPKPKATTPLRRSASASLPIRANPTPTRSDIQTVFTLTTAERYLLPKFRAHPNLIPNARPFHESWWFPRWGPKDGEGEVFVFANGSFVCWGLGEQDARMFASEVLQRVSGIEISSLKEAETEELEFVTDPTETTRLQGDLIILGQTSTPPTSSDLPSMVFPSESVLSRYAFSQALSRSTALSALEVSLDEYLSSMALLPHSLEKTGKPGLGREALIKKLGQLMKFRQGLNLNRENFSDVPDFYWTEPELEHHFNSLTDALEVKQRTDSVNDKITYAAELQSVLRQLLTESSSHMLELVIIALIAVEVVIALIRDGPELWHMIRGTGDDEKKAAGEIDI